MTSSSLFDDLLKPAVDITELNDQPLSDNTVGVQPGAPHQGHHERGHAQPGPHHQVGRDPPAEGTFTDNDTVWVSNEALGYNRTYTLETDAVGIGGAVTKKVTFTTSSPQQPDAGLPDPRARVRPSASASRSR